MRRSIVAAAIAVPVLAAAFFAAGYVSDEVAGTPRVSRGVSALDIDLSRMTVDQATAAIAAYEASLVSQPLTVIIEGKELSLSPSAVGFAIDEDAIVSQAMTVRRSSGLVANIRSWLATLTSTTRIEVPTSINEDATKDLLDEWTSTVVDAPAREGGVRVVNGSAVAEYSQSGLRIDVAASLPLILEQLSRSERSVVVLPLVAFDAILTNADVDAAVVEAAALIDSPVVLTARGQVGTIVYTSAGLTTALRSETATQSHAAIKVYLDPETLRHIALRSATNFVIPPIEATFLFDEETRELEVVPSVVGQTVDLDAIPEVVIAAAMGAGRGAIPMMDGDEAMLTTQMAQNMGPFGEVSTFTTLHPCCQNRVTNIQLLADEIRGAIVLPGEEFSVNDRAGIRTLEEGYVRAGAIISGRIQCCDSVINIGGGTSQFATTFYNTVFFGCYVDVFHQPHSLYFSRYPFVREATLGFPLPDVVFRNDSDSVVYIHTEYTSTSITVTFYGNNGGRTCTSERNGNTITRVMTHPDGSVTTQEWTWKYRQPTTEPTTTTTTTTTVPPTTTITTTTVPPTTTTTTTTVPPTTTTEPQP